MAKDSQNKQLKKFRLKKSFKIGLLEQFLIYLKIFVDVTLYENIDQGQKFKKSNLKPQFRLKTQKVDDVMHGQTLIKKSKNQTKKFSESKKFCS